MDKKYLLKCAAFILPKEQGNNKNFHNLYKFLISLFQPYCDSFRIQMNCGEVPYQPLPEENLVCFVLKFETPLRQIKNVVNVANVLDGICKTIGSFPFVESAYFHIYEDEDGE